MTTFQYGFVADSASDITVSSIATNGTITPLLSSQYTLTINPPATNQLWGVGGTVLYPLSGSPLATGQSLLIQRILPYTQSTSVQNQGNYYAQVTEQALDTLEMQIQQLAARTTQFRGIWTTNTNYSNGDITQDGANGNNTKNYYICQNANLSGVWATDLAAGDWTISVVATVPTGGTTITLTGDVTASGSSPLPTTLATVNSNTGQFSGITVNGKGLVTAATALTGDITSSGAATTLATVNGNVGSFTAANITVNAKGLITAASNGSASRVTTVPVVIDTADISLSTVPTKANVGSVVSVTIPTKGQINWIVSFETVTTTTGNSVVFGLSIGTNLYWPSSTFNGTIDDAYTADDAGTAGTNIISSIGVNSVPRGGSQNKPAKVGNVQGIMIEQSGIPTGVQTIQVIAAKTDVYGANPCTIKGTAVTTRVYITIQDHT